MNLNEQLQQAYESGRRQALSEYHSSWSPAQFVDGHQLINGRYVKMPAPPRPGFTPNNPMTAKNALWKKIIDAKKAGDRTLLKTLLKQAVKAGYITGAVATQLLGAGTFAAFLALLIPLGLLALIVAIGYGAFVEPGFKGLDPNVEFGPNSGIHPDVLSARHPASVSTTPGGRPNIPHH